MSSACARNPEMLILVLTFQFIYFSHQSNLHQPCSIGSARRNLSQRPRGFSSIESLVSCRHSPSGFHRIFAGKPLEDVFLHLLDAFALDDGQIGQTIERIEYQRDSHPECLVGQSHFGIEYASSLSLLLFWAATKLRTCSRRERLASSSCISTRCHAHDSSAKCIGRFLANFANATSGSSLAMTIIGGTSRWATAVKPKCSKQHTATLWSTVLSRRKAVRSIRRWFVGLVARERRRDTSIFLDRRTITRTTSRQRSSW